MAIHDKILDPIRKVLAKPAEEANRWQRAVQFAVTLARHCWRQLYEDKAPEMAAALTYRTIFGLVPFLVLALIVFRAFGGFQDIGQEIQGKIYDYLGLSNIAARQVQVEEQIEEEQVFATEEGERAEEQLKEQVAQAERAEAQQAAQTQSPETVEEKQELQAQLENVLNDLNDRVAQVSFKSIGAVGLVLLIWAALALVVTVEDCFNSIYRSDRGRSWHMRVAIYWAIITLGPVLIMLSMWLAGEVTEWIDGIAPVNQPPAEQAPVDPSPAGASPADPVPAEPPSAVQMYFAVGVAWVLAVLGRLAAFAATWGLLFLLYVLMPNTSVRLRSAVVGSFVAALLWEGAKAAFAFYVERAVGYSALYGSLGLIPLFLFWLYLTWLIILFGLELTYTLQHMRGKRLTLKAEEREIMFDPRWMIPVMAVVGEAFNRGATISADQIATRTELPLRAITRLGDQLVREGLLHRVQGTDNGGVAYALAQPPERIAVGRLLNIGENLAMDRRAARGIPGHDVLEHLETAQHTAAKDLTLARVLDQPGKA